MVRDPTTSETRAAGGLRRWRPHLARLLTVPLTALVVSTAMLVGAHPAHANSYLYLNQKSWSRTDAQGNGYTLTARIAIETDGSGSGWLRFRLLCSRTDAMTGKVTANSCDFHFASGDNAFWCHTQPPQLSPYTAPATCDARRHLDDQSGSDVVWLGTPHTLAHQAEWVFVKGFSATFNAGAGPVGTQHEIVSAGAIVNLAKTQLGYGETPNGSNCNYYSPYFGLGCQQWCADFARFIWYLTGVVPDSNLNSLAASFATDGDHHDYHADTSLSGIQPGDVVVYNGPDPGDDHVGIYIGTNSSGTKLVISGNASNQVSEDVVSFHPYLVGYTHPLV